MWQAMTVDDISDYQRACGVRVVKVNGVWWVEPRPFFFRPLFPLEELSPEFGKYPLQHLVGGVLHLVPQGVASNVSMRLFLYDRLQEYGLEGMPAKQKWVIKKSTENFEARRITERTEFIETAYPIYRSFYERTQYSYKKERAQQAAFARWAETLFRFPKILILGAYHENRLRAVDISYRVNGLIIDDVFFSDTESQGLRVTDFMVHTLRSRAAETDASYLFRGFPCGKQTLDESKIRRGCRIYKIPAFCKINPIALYVGKRFLNESYRKLMTITAGSYLDGRKTAEVAAEE